MLKKLLIFLFAALATTTLAITALAGADVTPVPGDQRAADRDAIRAHIDSIFQAYIDKDVETIRATHAEHWRGFRRQSRSILRGIDGYMAGIQDLKTRPGRMHAYRMKEFDVIFYGDVGIVSYVAEMDVGFEKVEGVLTIRTLDVYARLDGHWNQVASNVATHPDTPDDMRSPPPKRDR